MEMQTEDPASPITPAGQGWEGKPRGRGTTEEPWPSAGPGSLLGGGNPTASSEDSEFSLRMAEDAPSRLEKYLQSRALCQFYARHLACINF